MTPDDLLLAIIKKYILNSYVNMSTKPIALHTLYESHMSRILIGGLTQNQQNIGMAELYVDHQMLIIANYEATPIRQAQINFLNSSERAIARMFYETFGIFCKKNLQRRFRKHKKL